MITYRVVAQIEAFCWYHCVSLNEYVLARLKEIRDGSGRL
jgi:hypothetical protein